jgi:hypothetical protein
MDTFLSLTLGLSARVLPQITGEGNKDVRIGKTYNIGELPATNYKLLYEFCYSFPKLPHSIMIQFVFMIIKFIR